MEPKEEDDFSFHNHIIGTNIPPEYIPSVEKGVQEIGEMGVLVGCPLTKMKFVLEDGAYHAVDSSDMAFRTATMQAIREAIRKSDSGSILEPIMKVEIQCPTEFQGNVIGGINRRRGQISSSDSNADGIFCTITADVPLSKMFGYSTDLRSNTQGKGEFSMEYLCHSMLPRDEQNNVIKKHETERNKKS